MFARSLQILAPVLGVAGLGFVYLSLPTWTGLPRAAAAALEAPGRAYIYSLKTVSGPNPKADQLDGWEIAGHVELDAQETQFTIAALKESIPPPHWQWGIKTTMCFSPHHALRIERAGHVIDFLICYQCHKLVLFEDGKRLGESWLEGSSKPFDDLLATAHLSISP